MSPVGAAALTAFSIGWLMLVGYIMRSARTFELQARKQQAAADVGYRCGICGVSWPDDRAFDPCPECEQPTQRMSMMEPLSLDEAWTRKRHADFERFYARRSACS